MIKMTEKNNSFEERIAKVREERAKNRSISRRMTKEFLDEIEKIIKGTGEFALKEAKKAMGTDGSIVYQDKEGNIVQKFVDGRIEILEKRDEDER